MVLPNQVQAVLYY